MSSDPFTDTEMSHHDPHAALPRPASSGGGWMAPAAPSPLGPVEIVKRLHAAPPGRPSFGHHLRALTIKSGLLKIRAPVVTAAELLLPVVFAAALVGIWASTSDTDHPAKSFGGEPLSFDVNASTALCAHGTVLAGVRPCTAADTLVKCSNATLLPVQGLCAVVDPAPLWRGFVSSFDQPRAVPALDTLITMQWLLQLDGASRGSFRSPQRGLYSGGFMYFAPVSAATARLMSHLANTSVLFQHVNRGAVADEAALKAIVQASGRTLEQPNTGMLVTVNAWTNASLSVTYYTNRSATASGKRTEDLHAVGLGEKAGRAYITAGVPTMMQAVMEAYANEFGHTAPAPADMTTMAYLKYTDYEFINSAGGFVATFLVFGYLYSVSQLTRVLVEEKESRIREAMHVMGLGVLSFYVSWLATYTVMALVTSLLLALLYSLTILGKASFILVFLAFFLFAMTIVCLSVLLSTFFSHSRVSSFVGPTLFFVLALPAMMLPAMDPTGGVYLGFSVFSSPVTFARATNQLLEWEKTTGASFSNMAEDPDGYSLQLTFIMFLVNCVTYLVLGLYLDAVLPSEWGTSRRCCFCFCLCGCCGKAADRGCDADGKPFDGRDPNGAFEAVQRSSAPTVRLTGLRKEFATPLGKMTAVDDLTLDLHEGEVTVLLGHNGAGKTTAINMMTGMADVTAGDCELYGASVRDDLAAARQEIGMCPQHNILWDGLTCEEHLRFFARLKGFSGAELDELVDAMLAAVDLKDKASARSSELSGGQKRKLSVANAFVGGSRMVFLDEPTAGMDVGARRFTWDLIKQMSPGRTIMLTTHFMDEADLLGNSVAIMAKGRLRCMGSSMFLKSRLGAGYTLTLSCLPHAQPHAITKQVQAAAHGAAVLSSSAGELSLQVPMTDVPALPAVLAMLEQDMAALGVQSYALSLTTLEEIFLKQAEAHDDDDAEKQKTADHTPVAVALAPKEAMAAVAETLWSDVPRASWTQPLALLMKRVHNMKRDRRAQVLQVVVPVICVALALLFSLMNFDKVVELSVGDLYKGSEIATAACPAGFNAFADPGQLVTSTPLDNGSALNGWLTSTAADHSTDRVMAFSCGARDGAAAPWNASASTAPARALVMFNETGFHHAAVFAAHIHGAAALRASANTTELSVETKVSALPLTGNLAKAYASQVDAFVGLMLIIPFALLPSTYVAWVVRERQCKAKHLQSICGMHFALYWACNFVFDAVCYVLTAGLVFVVLLAAGRDEYIGGSTAGATLLLLLFYGASSIAVAYLVSFLFKDFSTAQNVVMMLNVVMGVIVVLGHFILDAVIATRSFAEFLVFPLRLHPSFCFGHGMLQLAAAGAQHNAIEQFKPLSMTVVGWDLVFMALALPIAAAATLVLDRPDHLASAQGVPEIIDAEDSDVAAERAAVEEGRQRDAAVLLSSLRKEYTAHGRTKVAVKNLSLAVQRGEVFGFLGTNGAGKTTTMSMLCGEFAPTGGQAWIAGKNIVTEAGEVRKMLGYCPQFDALLDLLTVEEHLELYAGLRGLTGADRARAVDALIDACDLAPHRTKESRALSGGNKRKLSVAISLVGGPQVVFLDEPSAGMDPKARRGMWDVLEIVAKHCCIVLTTHHLEEIEALATRVAIMDQGEMKCIGALPHLKTKFGTGYEMGLRVQAEADAPAAEAFVARTMPGARLEESRGGRLTYSLPHDAKLSQAFSLLEAHRTDLRLTDYTVSQSSLESVFLKIQAGGHPDEDL